MEEVSRNYISELRVQHTDLVTIDTLLIFITEMKSSKEKVGILLPKMEEYVRGLCNAEYLYQFYHEKSINN
jgi:hypothetical protein